MIGLGGVEEKVLGDMEVNRRARDRGSNRKWGNGRERWSCIPHHHNPFLPILPSHHHHPYHHHPPDPTLTQIIHTTTTQAPSSSPESKPQHEPNALSHVEEIPNLHKNTPPYKYTNPATFSSYPHCIKTHNRIDPPHFIKPSKGTI